MNLRLRKFLFSAVLAVSMLFPQVSYASEAAASEVSPASLSFSSFRINYVNDSGNVINVAAGTAQPEDFASLCQLLVDVSYSGVHGNRSVVVFDVPALADGSVITQVSLGFGYTDASGYAYRTYPVFRVSGTSVSVTIDWDSIPCVDDYSKAIFSVGISPASRYVNTFTAAADSSVTSSTLLGGVTSLLVWILDMMTDVCSWILGNSLAFIFVGLFLAGCVIGFLMRVLNSV